jgi:recombination protein RecA
MAQAISPEEFYKRLSKEDKKALKNLNEQSKIEYISTGSWVINTLIGDGTGSYKPGGLPRGHIVEVFGDESCGKTTLGICACKQAQDLGGVAVWLDFERTFHKDYAKKLGLSLDQNKFFYWVPDHFEHGTKLIYEAMAMHPMIIVVDSVSAMIPKQFLEGAVDEMGRIGLQAQLMSISLNYLTKFLPDSNTCLLFTNQLRSVIKKREWDVGPDEETSGGKALKYYSSVRIKMKKGAVEKITTKSRITGKDDKEPVNVMVKVSIVKNKIDKPYLTAPLFIRFGDGFDNIASIVELAINTNTIKKKGAFLNFEVDGKTIFNAQGKEQLHTILQENNDILSLLSSKIVLLQDKEIKAIGEKEKAEEESISTDLDLMLNQASETFVKGRNAKTTDPEEESEEPVEDTKEKKTKRNAKRKD